MSVDLRVYLFKTKYAKELNRYADCMERSLMASHPDRYRAFTALLNARREGFAGVGIDIVSLGEEILDERRANSSSIQNVEAEHRGN